eukprot:TRINITY_DN7074_c0_g2_i2.p1 TRINITY_DN7074_c0_g2~~TRINITY_DN7074_c0_g2_i2.p1  ORF type:complete len:1781 (+),score=625.45 TRINITY_DN7074_c0_g2_i2:87-5429(+)
MIRRPPRSTLSSSSAASDVYKRQVSELEQQDESAKFAERSLEKKVQDATDKAKQLEQQVHEDQKLQGGLLGPVDMSVGRAQIATLNQQIEQQRMNVSELRTSADMLHAQAMSDEINLQETKKLLHIATEREAVASEALAKEHRALTAQRTKLSHDQQIAHDVVLNQNRTTGDLEAEVVAAQARFSKAAAALTRLRSETATAWKQMRSAQEKLKESSTQSRSAQEELAGTLTDLRQLQDRYQSAKVASDSTVSERDRLAQQHEQLTSTVASQDDLHTNVTNEAQSLSSEARDLSFQVKAARLALQAAVQQQHVLKAHLDDATATSHRLDAQVHGLKIRLGFQKPQLRQATAVSKWQHQNAEHNQAIRRVSAWKEMPKDSKLANASARWWAQLAEHPVDAQQQTLVQQRILKVASELHAARALAAQRALNAANSEAAAEDAAGAVELAVAHERARLTDTTKDDRAVQLYEDKVHVLSATQSNVVDAEFQLQLAQDKLKQTETEFSWTQASLARASSGAIDHLTHQMQRLAIEQVVQACDVTAREGDLQKATAKAHSAATEAARQAAVKEATILMPRALRLGRVSVARASAGLSQAQAAVSSTQKDLELNARRIELLRLCRSLQSSRQNMTLASLRVQSRTGWSEARSPGLPSEVLASDFAASRAQKTLEAQQVHMQGALDGAHSKLVLAEHTAREAQLSEQAASSQWEAQWTLEGDHSRCAAPANASMDLGNRPSKQSCFEQYSVQQEPGWSFLVYRATDGRCEAFEECEVVFADHKPMQVFRNSRVHQQQEPAEGELVLLEEASGRVGLHSPGDEVMRAHRRLEQARSTAAKARLSATAAKNDALAAEAKLNVAQRSLAAVTQPLGTDELTEDLESLQAQEHHAVVTIEQEAEAQGERAAQPGVLDSARLRVEASEGMAMAAGLEARDVADSKVKLQHLLQMKQQQHMQSLDVLDAAKAKLSRMRLHISELQQGLEQVVHKVQTARHQTHRAQRKATQSESLADETRQAQQATEESLLHQTMQGQLQTETAGQLQQRVQAVAAKVAQEEEQSASLGHEAALEQTTAVQGFAKHAALLQQQRQAAKAAVELQRKFVALKSELLTQQRPEGTDDLVHKDSDIYRQIREEGKSMTEEHASRYQELQRRQKEYSTAEQVSLEATSQLKLLKAQAQAAGHQLEAQQARLSTLQTKQEQDQAQNRQRVAALAAAKTATAGAESALKTADRDKDLDSRQEQLALKQASRVQTELQEEASKATRLAHLAKARLNNEKSLVLEGSQTRDREIELEAAAEKAAEYMHQAEAQTERERDADRLLQDKFAQEQAAYEDAALKDNHSLALVHDLSVQDASDVNKVNQTVKHIQQQQQDIRLEDQRLAVGEVRVQHSKQLADKSSTVAARQQHLVVVARAAATRSEQQDAAAGGDAVSVQAKLKHLEAEVALVEDEVSTREFVASSAKQQLTEARSSEAQSQQAEGEEQQELIASVKTNEVDRAKRDRAVSELQRARESAQQARLQLQQNVRDSSSAQVECDEATTVKQMDTLETLADDLMVNQTSLEQQQAVEESMLAQLSAISNETTAEAQDKEYALQQALAQKQQALEAVSTQYEQDRKASMAAQGAESSAQQQLKQASAEEARLLQQHRKREQHAAQKEQQIKHTEEQIVAAQHKAVEAGHKERALRQQLQQQQTRLEQLEVEEPSDEIALPATETGFARQSQQLKQRVGKTEAQARALREEQAVALRKLKKLQQETFDIADKTRKLSLAVTLNAAQAKEALVNQEGKTIT